MESGRGSVGLHHVGGYNTSASYYFRVRAVLLKSASQDSKAELGIASDQDVWRLFEVSRAHTLWSISRQMSMTRS